MALVTAAPRARLLTSVVNIVSSDQVVMFSLLQTVITADELMETSDVLNQVSAASVVQQNAATLFYCDAPELFCGLRHFMGSSGE